MPGLLALLAHPDDELFCAGLLASARVKGVPAHLVYWTRGEGSGSARRRRLWSFVPRAWHYRVWEARRAARVLGAGSVTFLGAVDPAPEGGPRAPAQSSDDLSARLGDIAARLKPDLLLTHGSNGEYGHPAHRRLHEEARAWTRWNACPLATFAATVPGVAPAAFWNRDDPADYILDAQPFLAQKIAVLRAHASQRGVFEKLADPGAPSRERLLEAGRFEGYRCWGDEPARVAAHEWLSRATV